MIAPVILAGGSGTRLWPLSRELYPKQLMNLVDEQTLLQNTILRLKDYENVGPPIILCNENHRFMVAEQLHTIHIDPTAIILEPVGRNTAPAITVAALRLLADNNDATLLILPADHYIRDVATFHKALKTGETLAEQKNLITFGIVPTAPETGYGYIEMGEPLPAENHQVKSYIIENFVEKPDLKTAEGYIQSGNYCWNSGMFMFKASRIIEELEKYVPDILSACKRAYDNGQPDLDFFRLNIDAFRSCPSDSIDYAVMEKTDRGVMVPLDAGWNDVGSWEALWQVGKKDASANVIHGDVLVSDVKDSYLYSNSRLLAAVGLENHIVVETSDAVLISPRNRVQDVKQIVNQVKQQNRREALSHKKGYRPWGTIESMDHSERFQVKRITVDPGAKLSLQKHFHRAEHWIVVKGTALVTKDEENFILKEDESTYIPIGVTHRLENPGKIPLDLIEVRTGSFLGEDDIVRFDDVYGRKS